MKLRRSHVFALSASILFAACGDDDPVAPEVEEDVVSFAEDVMEVLNRKGCTSSGCHGAGVGGLTLSSAAVSYAAMVNVASVRTGQILIIPGDAANSYLMKKLIGAPDIEGAQMPRGGAALDEVDLGKIRDWINAGALNN